jgi:pantetheine-phosphate adenylyltransferase
VAVAHRHHKQTLFDIEERIALIEEGMPAAYRGRTTVRTFSGLLVDFARQAGVQMIVRGLRVISDFEYEFQMALMNKRLWPEIETVFLMPGETYIYLNSTLVKEVARNHGATGQFVTPNVESALIDRFGSPAD